MQTIKIIEGAAKLIIPKAKRIYDADVFYNPDQVVNRDISILITKALLDRNAAVLDLLSASGVRAIRFAKEAGLKNVYANDANPVAYKLILKNARLNKAKIIASNLRAHEFLATRYKLKDKKFDYIDVDPFGTPVPFLDAVVKALNPRGGILAVTATDTAALCGSAPKACLRKYGAVPLRNELMHEIGIRILLKKIIEVGAQYDLALTPIFVHSTLHYMRVYLQANSGAEVANKILEQVGMFEHAGPMWLGRLWDEKLAGKIYLLAIKNKYICDETNNLLFQIKNESKINSFGFYDLATFKLKQVPKISDVIAGLHAKGFRAARTHFSPTGIRTNAAKNKFLEILKA